LSFWLGSTSRNANLTRAGATAQICERFSTSSPDAGFGAERTHSLKGEKTTKPELAGYDNVAGPKPNHLCRLCQTPD